MTEQTQKPKSTYIKLKDAPEGYKRKHSVDEMFNKLYDRVRGNEFLYDFLKSNAVREKGYPLSPKVEAILNKIAFTFEDVLNAPKKEMSKQPFDDGLDLELPF